MDTLFQFSILNTSKNSKSNQSILKEINPEHSRTDAETESPIL